MMRFLRWFFGELPEFTRERDSGRLVLWVGVGAALAILLGEFHALRGHPLLRGFWRLTVHGVIPLVVAVAWTLRDKARGRGWLVLGGLAIAAPILARLFWDPAPRTFRTDPAWLYGPVLLGLICLGVALRRGGASLADWGAGLGEWRWWGPRLLLCLAILVPGLVVACVLDPELSGYYPTWRASRESWGAFGVQHLGIGLDFLGWEFLFRGFLLFGFARRGDAATAIWVQVFPFFLLHSGKPYFELLTSIPGGLAAGWFCLRGRSFLPLFVIHWVQMTTVGAMGVLLQS